MQDNQFSFVTFVKEVAALNQADHAERVIAYYGQWWTEQWDGENEAVKTNITTQNPQLGRLWIQFWANGKQKEHADELIEAMNQSLKFVGMEEGIQGDAVMSFGLLGWYLLEEYRRKFLDVPMRAQVVA